MKITKRQLRKIINEIAISPAFFKETQPIKDPFDKKALAEAVQEVANQFEKYMKNDMVVAQNGAYDPKTRQFDDTVYAKIEKTAADAKQALINSIKKSIMQLWNNSRASSGAGNKDIARVD